MRIALLIASVLLTSAAAAQEPARTVWEPERARPYLAFTLGELHYLAYACEGAGTQQWRDRMLELLNIEAPEGDYRRERLIQSFNDGFRMQERQRLRCGSQVEAERFALAQRGRELSDALLEAALE